MNRDSYRLSTDAQALNVTRPRTSWWDGFDASLRTHQDALGGLNEAAVTIAERALDLDTNNLLAQSQLARQLLILGEDRERTRAELHTLFAGGGSLAWTATLYDVDAKSFFVMTFSRDGITVYSLGRTKFPGRLPAEPKPMMNVPSGPNFCTRARIGSVT